MPKVLIDPGHGDKDTGTRGNGLVEKVLNLQVGLQVQNLLRAAGVEVVMTREDDRFLTLMQRTELARSSGVTHLVSIHHNGVPDPAAHGIETWQSIRGGESQQLAQAVHPRLVEALGLADRGIKSKANKLGHDWYHMLRESPVPSIITESGFVTNPSDAAVLSKLETIEKEAKAIAAGIIDFFGVDSAQRETGEILILGPAQATVEQAQVWARGRGATEEFTGLAPLYWQLAPMRGGVRPEVAYAQAAKETAFGRFGGVIDASFRNPCGLKTSRGGGNNEPAAHQRFPDWETGVNAHLDHLALYAGAPGYPRGDTPDPRHFPSIRGVSPTVEALGGRWAPSPDYGVSIVRDYLAPLLATPIPIPQPDPYAGVPEYARATARKLHEAGLLHELRGGEDFWRAMAVMDRTGAFDR